MRNNARKNRWFALLAAMSLLAAAPLFAHHGTGASYDLTKKVTLTGVVTEWIYTNPHAELFFDVKDSSGNVVHWGGELGSPGVLRQMGWSKTTFKAGDMVTVTVSPSKAGTTIGVVDQSKPIVVNGKELPGRASNAE
jgi:hypothetical protein